MRLFADGADYCGAEILDSWDDETHIFGQLASIGGDKRFSLQLDKRLMVGAGDTRKFELRDDKKRIAISPFGGTDGSGLIEALFDGELPPIDAEAPETPKG